MALWAAIAACDVEWAGARLALEDPSPVTEDPTAEAPTPRAEPLPPGPLLYAARLEPSGDALVVPVARLAGTLEPLGLPASITEEYRARFDSTFLRPGLELSLQSGGRRIGTLVLTAPATSADAACPSLARATALLLPGQPVPRIAFALPQEIPARPPERVAAMEPSRAMVVAGPVLAERLIDDRRAFLAQRVALLSVPARDDTLPWMAATYLVSDSLATGPPAGDAISLFFLARYKKGRGYSSVWQEVRRYDSADQKEAFEYLDWLSAPGGRIDFLRRYGGSRVGLVASLLPEAGTSGERGIDFAESGGCRVLELLER